MTDETAASPEAAPASEAPIVEAAEAVAATVTDPSIGVLAEDLLLVHKLITQVKAELAGKSASVANVFKALFNLV